jgi:hypothetical protein
MSTVSTTAMDLVVSALRNINALEAGEVPNQNDAADALQTLNDMMESWSTDKLFVYAGVENLLSWTPGQYQYTVGNPVGGTFSGTLVGSSPTISNVTIPANLILGGTVTDFNAQVPPGTTITAIGTNTVTMSANALSTVSTPETFTYTTPGNFGIARPLRVTRAFTRITSAGTTGLDYPIDVDETGDKYAAIGLKGIPGPWPILLYYNPTFPFGNLYCYPNPQQAGVLHLWTDTIFTDFVNPTQLINLPQGYARAIKKSLALELVPEYGKIGSTRLALLQGQARDAVEKIKKLNSTPAVQAFFDRDIVRTRRTDAGWIFHGGFN